jgi:hypothetical protein
MSLGFTASDAVGRGERVQLLYCRMETVDSVLAGNHGVYIRLHSEVMGNLDYDAVLYRTDRQIATGYQVRCGESLLMIS